MKEHGASTARVTPIGSASVKERVWKGLTRCQDCIDVEENSLGWYTENAEEPLLKTLKTLKKDAVINTWNSVTKEDIKKRKGAGVAL